MEAARFHLGKATGFHSFERNCLVLRSGLAVGFWEKGFDLLVRLKTVIIAVLISWTVLQRPSLPTVLIFPPGCKADLLVVLLCRPGW